MRRMIAWCLALLVLTGCEDASKPAASFAGGGFMFNYRVGEAFYGVVIKTEKRLPPETIIQAEFQDPAGGAPIMVTENVRKEQRKYMLRTPALKGIKKDVPYKVVVKILDRPGGQEIGRIERAFKSDVDQSVMPDGPLIIGPGYTINPENDITKTP
jgi:hypothetical protein